MKDPGSEGEMPDWLRRIRMRGQADKEMARTPVAGDGEPGGDIPDWLGGLEPPAESTSTMLPSEPGVSAGESDAWLANLRAWQTDLQDQAVGTPGTPEQVKPEIPVVEPFPMEDGTPDWLKAFAELPASGESEPVETPQPAFETEKEEEVPHWLQTSAADEDYDEAAHPASEIPDWLKDMASTPAQPQNEQPPSQAGSSEQVDDWLATLPAAADGLSEGMIPDELADGLENEQTESATPFINLKPTRIVEPPLFATDDLNWLMASDEVLPSAPIEEEPKGVIEPFTAELPPPAAVEKPKGSAAPFGSGLNPSSTMEPPVFGTADIRWLNAFDEELKRGPAKQEPASGAGPFTADLPSARPAEPPVFGTEDLNWIKAFEVNQIPTANGKIPPAGLDIDQSLFTGEQPPILPVEPFLPVEEPQKPSTPEKRSESGAEPFLIPGQDAGLETPESLPAWLDAIEDELLDNVEEVKLDVETTEAQAAVEPRTDMENAAPELGGNDLEWLEEIRSDRDILAEAQPSGWIEESTGLPVESAQPVVPAGQLESEASPPEKDEALSESELPGWIQALRPLEAVVHVPTRPVSESRIETAGPLTGFKGVLPAEDLNTLYQNPATFSGQLRLSERQRAHVTLLEDMVAAEGQPQPAVEEKQRSRLRLARILAGLLLFGIVLIPLLTGFPGAVLPPDSASPQVVNFYQKVLALPESAPVLLASDFQAAYAGEMRFAATPLLVELISRGQPIAVVSSIPAGPVLAEDLLRGAQQEVDLRGGSSAVEDKLADSITNLGYLPGGMTSLQEFSQNPRNAAPGYSGSPGWNATWLQQVSKAADFGAVIVLADSVETSRAWIEQVQPGLGDTPLLVVSSAQAAPLLAPYFESGQVGGLVAGLAGGAAFDLAAGGSSTSSDWSAYQIGILTAMSFLIAGALLQSISGMFSSTKPGRKR